MLCIDCILFHEEVTLFPITLESVLALLLPVIK